MRRRRPRNLSPEESRLWETFANRINPIERDLAQPRTKLNGSSSIPPAADPAPEDPVPAPRLPGFRLGERAATPPPGHDLALPLSEAIAATPVDRRTSRRIRRGGQGPERRIDLHGMTQAQAHPMLTRFILQAHADDLRMVLVITGKGKDRDEGGPLPVPVGVLRHQVPHWLMQGPLGRIVLRLAPAQRQHGGEGAYYVFLRRRR